MNDYRQGSKFDRPGQGDFRKKGFNKFDNRRSFGDSRFDKPMFDATCADCGQRCQVPFQPNGSRPIFCKDCFRRDERPDSNRRDDRAPQAKPFNEPVRSADYKRDFMELNRKLDDVIRMLQAMKHPSAPVTAKPVETKAPVAAVKAAAVAVEGPKKKAIKEKAKVEKKSKKK